MEFIQELRQTFASGKTKAVDWRKEQLLNLKCLLTDNEQAIYKALEQDLGKCEFETYVTEYSYVLHDIDLFLKHLTKWLKPVSLTSPLVVQPASSKWLYEPYGLSLIMGAWNYPIQLVLSPFVASLAAGNCVVLKPSELARNTSQLLAELLPKYLDTSAFHVYEGGIEETTELLKQRFDHIMYTGSATVGKIVMRAASEHLTPVCLELGGKSPCIVDDSANIKVSADRIIWGKFLNAGQTCIAPDYILVTPQQREPLIKALKASLVKQFGQTPNQSQDYGRIINQQHFQRLKAHLDALQTDLIIGGQSNQQEKFIAPTLLFNPELDSSLMQEEIFGPILPIIEIESVNHAIHFINQREKPLALYMFSKNDIAVKQVTEQTSSGTLCINDTMVFMVNHRMPFGGVGNSGMGSYHGKWGLDTFSHQKPVMHRRFFADVPVRYAPYTSWKQKVLKWLQKC